MKMKNIRKALAFCSAVILLTACSKDPVDTTNNNNNGGSTPGNGTQITSYTEFNTQLPTGRDTLNKMNFAYDGQRRLSSLTWYEFDTSGARVNGIYTFQLTYNNATDSLVNKIVLTQKSYTGGSSYSTSTTTSTFQYITNYLARVTHITNNNGTLDTAIYRYYTGGNLTTVVEDYIYQGWVTYSDTIDVTHTLSGSNVMSAVQKNGPATVTFNNTYDNNTNPLRVLAPVLMGYYYIWPEMGYFGSAAWSANNLTSYTAQYAYNGGGTTQTFNGQYTALYQYNQQGLPVKATYIKTDVYSGGNVSGKVVFGY